MPEKLSGIHEIFFVAGRKIKQQFPLTGL